MQVKRERLLNGTFPFWRIFMLLKNGLKLFPKGILGRVNVEKHAFFFPFPWIFYYFAA